MSIDSFGFGYTAFEGNYSVANPDPTPRGDREAAKAESAPKTGARDGSGAPVLPRSVREAGQRAGLWDETLRLSKADIEKIESAIRRDPELARALAALRGDPKRPDSRPNHAAVSLDIDESGNSVGQDAAPDPTSDQLALRQTSSAQEAQIEPVQAVERDIVTSRAEDRDVALSLLDMCDHDGDGIVTVQAALEHLVSNSADLIKFNDIELENILKLLTSNASQTPLPFGASAA